MRVGKRAACNARISAMALLRIEPGTRYQVYIDTIWIRNPKAIDLQTVPGYRGRVTYSTVPGWPAGTRTWYIRSLMEIGTGAISYLVCDDKLSWHSARATGVPRQPRPFLVRLQGSGE